MMNFTNFYEIMVKYTKMLTYGLFLTMENLIKKACCSFTAGFISIYNFDTKQFLALLLFDDNYLWQHDNPDL